MTCEARKEKLALLADQALPDEERAELLSHLDDCQLCRRELEELNALREALRRIPEPELDEAAGEALRRNVMAAVKEENRKRQRRRQTRLISVAASVAAVFLIGIFTVSMYNNSMPLPVSDSGVPIAVRGGTDPAFYEGEEQNAAAGGLAYSLPAENGKGGATAPPENAGAGKAALFNEKSDSPESVPPGSPAAVSEIRSKEDTGDAGTPLPEVYRKQLDRQYGPDGYRIGSCRLEEDGSYVFSVEAARREDLKPVPGEREIIYYKGRDGILWKTTGSS